MRTRLSSWPSRVSISVRVSGSTGWLGDSRASSTSDDALKNVPGRTCSRAEVSHVPRGTWLKDDEGDSAAFRIAWARICIGSFPDGECESHECSLSLTYVHSPQTRSRAPTTSRPF